MKFTKMHGIGNDYIYVNCFEEVVHDPERLAIVMSRPHFGVGSDGLILIEPSDTADFGMRIFNSDGSEPEMCGNGLRCAAQFMLELANGCGVIGMVYTAPAWRRMGVASYLMESARHYFWQHRVMECRIEVRSRMTPMLRLAASIGYSREKILKRLPGTNIDAAPAVKKPTGAKKRPAAPRKAPRPETR